MKLGLLGISIALIVILTVVSCLEPYNPPVIASNSKYLVVDAFLNSDNGSVVVSLSRTLPLYSQEPIPRETNATVILEDEDGVRSSLPENGNGNYSLESSPVNTEKKYRIYIRTSGLEEFYSEYIAIKKTPVIDSIYWVPEKDGINIYIDTHDPSANTRYYKWDFTETWEYTSPYASILKLVDGQVLPRYQDEDIYKCWKTEPSSQIYLSSTVRLKEDFISHFPLSFLQKGSQKYSRKYSVLVKQKAITEEAYNYWLQLRQTTESLGGLFDAMPSEIRGNFYNGSDPENPVLGFFSGGTVQEKRIFISFYDIPDYLQFVPSSFCTMDTILLADLQNYGNETLLISSYGVPFPLGYTTASPDCIDCRLEGGTTVKPSFWE